MGTAKETKNECEDREDRKWRRRREQDLEQGYIPRKRGKKGKGPVTFIERGREMCVVCMRKGEGRR